MTAKRRTVTRPRKGTTPVPTQRQAPEPKHTRGHQRAVLTYMQSNADRIITSEELAEATGLTALQVSGSISALKRKYPEHVNGPGHGQYRWLSQAANLPRGETTIVEVIRDDGDKRLVLDEAGAVWAMRKMADY